MVTINLTRRCNRQCIDCEIGSLAPSLDKDILTKSDLFWIIDQMYLIGIPKLAHCGGEPLLFDGIYDIITYAGQKEIYFSITTNGMKAYQFKENELIILRENNVQKNLSIDSFKENIQELIRGHPKRIKVNRNT